MADLVEEVGKALSTLVVSTLNEEQKVRVGALFAARSVAPQADVWSQIHLADFIINGLSGPEPLPSGATVGPDPAFLPDDDGDPGPQPPAADEDPDAWKDEPAPSAGTQWVGRRG